MEIIQTKSDYNGKAKNIQLHISHVTSSSDANESSVPTVISDGTSTVAD